MLLSKTIRKSIFTVLVSISIFVITLLPDLLNTVIYSNTYLAKMSDWYLMSEPDFYRMLQTEKIINPISLLQFQYYVEQAQSTGVLRSIYDVIGGEITEEKAEQIEKFKKKRIKQLKKREWLSSSSEE